MKSRNLITLSLLSLIVSPANAMFCPNSFNVINIGDSIETVNARCGAPTSQKTSKVTTDESQDWNYFMSGGALQSQASTLRLNVSFADNRVSNLSVNGTSMVTTNLCGGSISVGDSIERVKATCGKPLTINQSDTQEGVEFQAQKNSYTEFHYSSTPPVTLLFRDGKLIQRK